MPEPFPPAVGQRFAGRYELKSILRGSGPARVFLAGDGSGRPISLVVLDPASCTPEAWAALVRAVSDATASGIPGLVPLRAVQPAPPDPPHCFSDPPCDFTFERLRKDRSSPFWRQKDPPAWQRALRLGERAAEILEATHAATGAPHRALSATRCVWTPDDALKILDYGIGELEPAGGRPDDLEFRPPEQHAGRGDHRSDVYSLAAILFELISGERPRARLPVRLRSVVPNAPQDVDEVFAIALARDPAQRFQDMRAMRAALRGLIALGPAPPVAARAVHVRVPAGASDPPVAQHRGSPAPPIDTLALPRLPFSSAAGGDTPPIAGPSPPQPPDPRPETVSPPSLSEQPPRPAPAQAQGQRARPAVERSASTPAKERPSSPVSVAPSERSPADPPTERDLSPVGAKARIPSPSIANHHSSARAPTEPSPDRTEVLPRQPGYDRTEVLPRQPGPDRTEVLGRPSPLEPPTLTFKPHTIPARHAPETTLATPADDVTLAFQRSIPRPVTPPTGASLDPDRTAVELRHLSRVLNADSTLVLPEQGGRAVAPPAPVPAEPPPPRPPPQAPASAPPPGVAAPPPPERSPLKTALIAINIALLLLLLVVLVGSL